ncbi:membrane protein [Paenibacillus dendritiformis]|uniref:GtrA family protein n=1 Tax=Paenibacillus dendritiformis TaxID=130049 RepID=UPI0018CF7034|nr:membrane protein [Paenibacillus dendritiformis]
MNGAKLAVRGGARLFGRYAAVGAVNTLVGLGTVYVLLYAGWSHFHATFVGNSVGVGVSFILNRRYTFRYRGQWLPSLLRFISIALLCYGLAYQALHPAMSALASLLLPAWASPWKPYAAVLGEAAVYTAASFRLHRGVTFARASGGDDDTPPVEAGVK